VCARVFLMFVNDKRSGVDDCCVHHVCLYLHVCKYTCTCMYIYMCVHVCVCVRVCVWERERLCVRVLGVQQRPAQWRG